MSSIDERVVAMKFDNAQFEQGVKTSLNSLSELNKGLKLEGATKGLTDVGSAAKNLSLDFLSNGISAVADKFKAMSVIGITALANITTKAIDAGIQLVKSFTIAPILQGLDVYETKINAIQTILANTSSAGTNLKQVTDALNILNTYANQTVFSFADMTKNIGTFTAAGVGLQASVDSIKGIANLAALSGSSAEQASTAMYQLSQAIAAGSLKLEDWNSVVNAGLGGKVFQDALIATARAHGIAVDAMIKKEGSFRLSLQDGWITSQVLTDTLAQFTGDLSDAQLRSMGFTEQQAQGILKLGQAAVDSAVKIRTVTQLQAALREEVATAWATVWETLIGNIGDATSLLSKAHTAMESAFTNPVYALNKLLQGWEALGGRDLSIKAITNALSDLGAIIKPIKDAFREVFPPTTAQQLFNITLTLEKLSEKFKIGATTADELKRTFAGVFAVLGIGWDIIKAGVKFIAQLFDAATKGSGSFLGVTAKIGDFLVALKTAIEQGHGLELFFGRLGNFLSPPLELIGKLARAVENLFNKFDADKAAKDVTGVVAKLEPITRIGDLIAVIWGAAVVGIEKVWKVFLPIAEKIGNFFRNFSTWIEDGFGNINYGDILSTVNTGLFAGLVILIKNFFGKFKGSDNIASGFLDTIKESFEQLTTTLSAMQTTLRAATLLEIAAALGILTISVVALSQIDSAGLTRALTAMTVMFTQLFTSMAVFEKISGSKGFVKMAVVTGAMILLAIAVDILSIAVKNLASLDWDGLKKGLVGVAGILASLALFTKFSDANAAGILQGAGIILLALGIKILADAVKDLSGLSWSEIARGLVALAGSLVIISTALDLIPPTAPLGAAGVLIVALSLGKISEALQEMSKMSWGEIGKSLVALLGALAIISAALIVIPPTAPLGAASVLIVALSLSKITEALQEMATMSWGEIGRSLVALLGAFTIISAALFVIPPTAPLGAAAILIVALSLIQVAKVLQEFSQMSWTDIGKSLVELAGALGIITVALILTEGALPGAAAILIVAASLAILAPILQMFGNMSWEEIGKGLLMLAGVFVVIGGAGLLLAPVVPVLIGLGVAVTLLGAGMLLAGAGVLAFSIGLTALSVAGAAGAIAIVGIVTALIGLIPQVMTEIGLGIVAFAKVIATAGPAITGAITTVLMSLIDAINKLAPKIVETLYNLVQQMLHTMLKHVPDMVDTGLKLLTGILHGIANNIGGVVGAATSVIVNFINSISANLPRIVQAGANLIINFINGVANAIRSNSAALGQAGGNLASAIVEGMVRGIAGGIGKIADAARSAAKAALDSAKNVLGINSPSKEFEDVGEFSDKGLAVGLYKHSKVVSAAAANVGNVALQALSDSLSGISDLVSGDMDMVPKITPVLDLTNIKKDAGSIARVLGGIVPISVDSTFSKATDVSADFNTNKAPGDGTSGSAGTTFNFTQNNNSPKALSPSDIYRQTKNQLSVAKEALATDA